MSRSLLSLWLFGAVLTSTAVIVGIFVANPVLANWWIVRSSDEKCLVVDIEPTDKDKSVTKVGKDAYQTAEQAEADVRFAKNQRPKVSQHPIAERSETLTLATTCQCRREVAGLVECLPSDDGKEHLIWMQVEENSPPPQ